MSKKGLKYLAMIMAIITIVVIVLNVNIDLFSKNENKEEIFPGILGDTTIKSNEIGIDFIKSIITYDDFRGDIIQGYKANYNGTNGSVIIFMAEMKNNETAIQSVKEMILRNGYNASNNITDNDTVLDENITVLKLPVENPELYLMQKSQKVPWHYVFAKNNKVYWIGFSSRDVDYQMLMLITIYQNVAEKIVGIV